MALCRLGLLVTMRHLVAMDRILGLSKQARIDRVRVKLAAVTIQKCVTRVIGLNGGSSFLSAGHVFHPCLLCSFLRRYLQRLQQRVFLKKLWSVASWMAMFAKVWRQRRVEKVCALCDSRV